MSGKRQRPAHFQIDQKTLEYKQDPQQKKQVQVDSPDKIKQRTIYKIKIPGASQGSSVSDSKPKFTLFDTLPSSQQKTDKKQQSQKQQGAEKNSEAATKQLQDKKSQDKKQSQKKNIFNFSLSSGNGQSIFGNGIGIFTNNNLKSEGIFSKNNIFNKDAKATLVDKTQQGAAKSSSIFGGSQSIFGFSTNGVPPVKKQMAFPTFSKSKSNEDDEEGGQDDSKQLQALQKQAVDPSKSTGTYQYDSQCETLFQKKVLKIKKDSGDVIQNTEVVVQEDKQKNTHWVVIRLIATKNPIITGHLIKGKSEVKKLGNKDENVTLSVLSIKDKHPQRAILKLQFQKPEQGKEFRETIQKIIH